MSAGIAPSPIASAQGAAGQSSSGTNSRIDKPAWSKTVRKTAEGGFVMGNPDAEIKLVEFGSMTCSHCAHFDAEAFPALPQKYVDTGKVSYELRNFTLNPVDVPAALLARCAGPETYFDLTNAYFKNQTQFTDKLRAAPKVEMEAISKLPTAQQFAKIAEISGMSAFFGERGVGKAEASACLSDKAAVQELLEINKAASEKYRVEGTPTFILNGEKLDINTWPAIAERLSTMLKG